MGTARWRWRGCVARPRQCWGRGRSRACWWRGRDETCQGRGCVHLVLCVVAIFVLRGLRVGREEGGGPAVSVPSRYGEIALCWVSARGTHVGILGWDGMMAALSGRDVTRGRSASSWSWMARWWRGLALRPGSGAILGPWTLWQASCALWGVVSLCVRELGRWVRGVVSVLRVSALQHR